VDPKGRIHIVRPERPEWLKLLPAGVPIFPIWGFVDGSETCSCPAGAACKDAGKHPLTEHGLSEANHRPYDDS
jgi:hypothetical protein